MHEVIEGELPDHLGLDRGEALELAGHLLLGEVPPRGVEEEGPVAGLRSEEIGVERGELSSFRLSAKRRKRSRLRASIKAATIRRSRRCGLWPETPLRKSSPA